jgi:hypothetical protein
MVDGEKLTFDQIVHDHCSKAGVFAKRAGSALVEGAVYETAQEALDPMRDPELTADEKITAGASWFADQWGVPNSVETIAAVAIAIVQDPRTAR